MTLNELLLTVRININDVQKIKFSDYSLIPVVNDVLYAFSRALSETNSYIVKKKTPLIFVNQVADIPNDYYRILALTSNGEDVNPSDYQFIGNTIEIKSNVSADTLYYQGIVPRVTDLEDNIELPDEYAYLLPKYIKGIVVDGLAQKDLYIAVYQEVSSITSGKENAYVERELPFYI